MPPPIPSDPLAVASDEQLLQRAQEGNVEAFGAILMRHAPWLVGRAQDLSRARGESRSASDWVATVHRRALRDFRKGQTEIRSLRAWLLTILRHAVIDASRRRSARPREVTWTEALFESPEGAASGAAEQSEQLALVRRHIGMLSPQDQAILEWSFRDSLTDRAIAERLGMQLEAVKKRRRRALQRVRDIVGVACEAQEGGS